MKTLTTSLAAFAFIAGSLFANRSLELSSLEHLQALEATDMDAAKGALTWVNENALAHLPTAATLRAEEAFAGIAMAFHGAPTVVVAQD